MQKKNNKYNHYYNNNSLNQQSIDSIILYSMYQRKESRVKHTHTHIYIYTLLKEVTQSAQDSKLVKKMSNGYFINDHMSKAKTMLFYLNEVCLMK